MFYMKTRFYTIWRHLQWRHLLQHHISHYSALKVKAIWPPLFKMWVFKIENTGFYALKCKFVDFPDQNRGLYDFSHISPVAGPLTSCFFWDMWCPRLQFWLDPTPLSRSPVAHLILVLETWQLVWWFPRHPIMKFKWSCGSRLHQLWPGWPESQSYEWAIIGVFSVIWPFRDEINDWDSFVSAVKTVLNNKN